MSQSGSDVSVDTSSTIDIAQRRTGLTPSGSRVTTTYPYLTSVRDHLHQPQLPQPQQQAPLSRHYATFQEHADSVMRTENADDDAVATHHKARRESFAWGLRTGYEDETPKHSRNPMMPQRSHDQTPPKTEEIVGKNTHEDDVSSTRRSSLVQCDAVFSRPSTTRSSTAGTDIDSITRSDTVKSIGGLARSMTKLIPDIKPHRLSTDMKQQETLVSEAGQVGQPSSARVGRKGRKLSFQLPSSAEIEDLAGAPQQPSPVVEECPSPEPSSMVTSPDLPTKCSGLAARRQIKMDLTLPVGLPDLSSSRDRNGVNPVLLSSITPSRPRSPKTPWIRKTEPVWGRDTNFKATKNAQVVEEDEEMSATNMIANNDAGIQFIIESALPPATDPLATPSFIRPPQKIRDRCYISRPLTTRNRSGEANTSESDFGSTPDGRWTPEIPEEMSEQEARAQRELIQLAKTSRTSRSRRWPWSKSKASGPHEQTQVKLEGSDIRRSISINMFKRSNRLSEENVHEVDKKEKRPAKGYNAPWRRDRPVNKPPLPSASLANMLVPPTFVPPGCEKVNTPPMFDPASDVRGKLAEFFFDSNGFPATKNKPRTSPEGYWDSNAVLMSMTTDLGLSNSETDEEGPEGRQPATFHFGPVNETPGQFTTPGSYTGPDGYRGVKNLKGRSVRTPSSSGQDSWFRMHFGDHTSAIETSTVATLKEADERRKFEWLVPEHLPNSPLCPLHVKYVGPSRGLCYWHGRRSNGWGVEPGRNHSSHPLRIGEGSSAGWEVGRQATPRQDKSRRRLESLSSP